MGKLITAQGILKQKGYVQNKFDTAGFMQAVADMFGELPVEGKVTLQRVRMLDIGADGYPLTEEERRQGYFFRDEGDTSRRDQSRERLRQVARERQERLEGGGCGDLADRACRLVTALHSRLYKEYARSRASVPFGVFEEEETGFIALGEECPPQFLAYLQDMSRHVKETTVTTVRVSPELLYVMLRDDRVEDAVIAAASGAWQDANRLRDEELDIRQQMRAQEERRRQRTDALPPYTIYIDRPFFENAASLLQVMGGFVVERQVKKREKLCLVTLV